MTVLDHKVVDGRLEFVLPTLNGHQMIELQYGQAD